ncbi:hypothetical protein BJ138DRAFT_1153003 [Hygrophoropsis aurantiaca]|uniref:Uncharacterized protein n=1 Tax=Hygrophoropsis aurantiaca TaxID=72124 RepID=A0ACB8ACI9_9AGAM|nr:hypothetical protein BJ138DRAFT_1153003 [Hygrophoropsis aurantiaca]
MAFQFSVHPASSSSSGPSSPTESISSLPSVSSSYFFSSAAPSPPHPPVDIAHTHRLIIPSLALPEPLHVPSPYGKTLGDLRLLILTDPSTDDVTDALFRDNEDIVDVTSWEAKEYGNLIHASTDWIEHTDRHGLHKFEPARNVEIVKLSATAAPDDLSTLIHAPFNTLSEILDPHHPPSAALANLIASPWTPLYTALVVCSNSDEASSSKYNALIDILAPHIPIIVLPHLSSSSHSRLHTSSFRPSSSFALREGLFRSPETLSTLRYEAADRFLRWREVERSVKGIREYAVEDIRLSSLLTRHTSDVNPEGNAGIKWDKAKWEAEWEHRLSEDVASLRRGTITNRPHSQPSTPSCTGPYFDPLPVSSLFVLSLSTLYDSFFTPARKRLVNAFSVCRKSLSSSFAPDQSATPSPYAARSVPSLLADPQVRMAMVGSLCIGIGIGLFIRP